MTAGSRDEDDDVLDDEEDEDEEEVEAREMEGEFKSVCDDSAVLEFLHDE
jgi:hypothetical protein